MPATEQVVVQPAAAGNLSIAPPTFLERWGVVFVACIGGWTLLVGSGILICFFFYQPQFPNLAGLTPDQVKDAIGVHKQLVDQWRDSLSSIFDLLVTKTTLPIVTLLLGYLFGKKA